MTGTANSTEPGTPFRTRLLRMIVPLTIGMIGALCSVVWLAAYVGYAAQALAVLEAELSDVVFEVSASGTLDPDRYRWDEPHHVRGERRIDPMFLQVFDAEGNLLRASDNVVSLPGYPDAWLGEEALRRDAVPRIRKVSASGQSVYLQGSAIEAANGGVLGFVQVGRFVPSERALLDRLALILAVLFVVFSGFLVGVVQWSTSRFVRPLEAITRFADGLQPGALDRRLPAPELADRETVVLTRTVNGLLDRVETGMNDMREFTANAAHEIRTPLTALRGHVEVALRRDRPAAAYRETLEFVRDRLETQVSTVSALLLLARLDRTDQLAEIEPISLSVFCREATGNLASLGHEPIQMVCPDGEGCLIEGQPDLVMRAIANVLENALRHGGPAPVRITIQEGPDAYVVAISDQGPGIPMAVQKSVLNRFARGPEAAGDHPGGAGLGLAIAHRIMRMHAGDLELDSGPDGTVVRLLFPRRSGIDGSLANQE